MIQPLFTAAEVESDRALAESRMLDTFAIRIPTGTDYDPDADNGAGADVTTYADLFTTAGRVKVTANVARDVEAGARTAVEVRRELHIPVNSPAVPAGAVAFCIAVDDTSDPTLLDAALVLDGPAPGSQTTARRMQVSEVIS